MSIIFLPAGDIAKYVADGDVDMGITGQDIVAETGDCDAVHEAVQLGFGQCELAVQAPIGQYTEAKQLVGKRIVTSFPRLAERFFSDCDGGCDAATDITSVGGSVEVACALGLADGVVDLVESGATMRAAGLEVVDVIMETQAVLITNRTSQHAALIATLTRRISGYMHATHYVMLSYNILRSSVAAATRITPGTTSPTIVPLDAVDWVGVTAMVSKQHVTQVMDELEDLGATGIVLLRIGNCRVPGMCSKKI